MNPGLRFLLRRSLRGRLRFLGRRMRTAKGAVSVIATGGFLLLIVGAQLAGRWMGEPGLPREEVLLFGPLFLLLLFVPQLLASRGLHFTPSEVDFLFPAPVTRRERMAYHLAARVPAQMLAGLWAALYTARNAPLLSAGIAGMVLAITFTYLLAQWVALLRVRGEQALPPLPRRVAEGALLALAAAPVVLAWAATPADAGIWTRLGMVAEAPAVRVLTLPLRPFAELYAAPSAAAALPWLAVALLLCAAMAAVILATDVPYEEKALAVSRRINERAARQRSGGGASASRRREGTRARRVPIPRLAFLGGAAPVARRHLLSLARAPRTLLPVLLVGVLAIGAVLLAGQGEDASTAAGLLAGAFMVLLFMGLGMRLDFRADLDRMAFLKSLPLRPITVAVGQLFPGTLVVSLVLMTAGVGCAVAAGTVPPPEAATVLLVVPVLVWCLLAVDNALFLLLPYRPPAPGDPTSAYSGRNLLLVLLKLLALSTLLGVTALTAWGAHALSGGSVAAAAGAAGVVVLALAALLTAGVAAAFSAFDVHRDVPG